MGIVYSARLARGANNRSIMSAGVHPRDTKHDVGLNILNLEVNKLPQYSRFSLLGAEK